jgi:hypothetical protein
MFPALRLGVIREETVGCTLLANQVFKSLGDIRFKTHGEGYKIVFKLVLPA